MPRKPSKLGKTPVVVGCALIALILAAGLFYLTTDRKERDTAEKEAARAIVPPTAGSVIDYGKLENEEELDKLMKDRKEEYGVKDSVDMIVTSDESIKVGDNTVSMEEILDKVRLKQGRFIEKDLGWGNKAEKGEGGKKEGFGVYVVQPGDNIWNIHFRLLKDFFEERGVDLPPLSDESDKNGTSSGVGRILKFSENMVYIFNLESRKLDANIHLIEPLGKVVVYRMDEVFDLLEQIDLSRVNTIRFDGENLWIPAEG